MLRLFSAGVPQGVTFSTVRELLLSVRGVVGVHSLHMWSLNMTHSLLSVHVATGETNTANLDFTRSLGVGDVVLQQQIKKMLMKFNTLCRLILL